MLFSYIFFFYSCCISSRLHASTSSSYATPWNVTTTTPWNDATTSRSSATTWRFTVSYPTSWRDATAWITTPSWNTTPWGSTGKNATSPCWGKSATANCWKILMKESPSKEIYLILTFSSYAKNQFLIKPRIQLFEG